MSLLGTTLTLWLGPTVPIPASASLLHAVDSIEVSTSDTGRSGFQITFKAGRGQSDLLDYEFLQGPALAPFSRVLIMVTFGAMPEVLMDGIITNQQLSPGNGPGSTTITVTGEDVSVMMDLEEKSEEHPAQPEMVIALKLIASYAQYGMVPTVIPPPSVDMPLPTERIPVQQGTDLAYLQEMAARYAYVFYVTPGPAPMMNIAYWGPPVRVGMPQRALSVNMGPSSNVTSIQGQYDALAPSTVTGNVQDRRLGTQLPVQTFASTRMPLSRQPALLMQAHTRTRQMRESGLDITQAYTRAQATTDAASDSTMSLSGELDALRYEGILKPRALVGVRGLGDTYDGSYYVQSVDHSIRQGSYTQRFSLSREGTGALLPVVVP